MNLEFPFTFTSNSDFFKISPEISIHYEIVEKVLPHDSLFIHGNLASNRWWYPTVTLLEQQAQLSPQSGSMIMVEFRGCGKSSAPINESDVNMHFFAEDFIKLIKQLNFKKLDIVGHSTGGNIACLMLAKHPELFRKALLLDPVGPRGVMFEEHMIDTFERMKKDKRLVTLVLGSTIYHNKPDSAFFKEMIVEDAFTGVKQVGHLVIKALNRFNIEEDVRKITTPTLILHGSMDLVLDIKESILLHQLIKDSEFIEIPHQGHCLNVENPKKFTQILMNFFSDIKPIFLQ
ncbi:MAG: alpha/beta hydrolase [Bdellovibrionaceae bacterium]|nr:alpha/beta hydrolase [Pseudobdellovibrionaceae bacterium]NUM57967.1 alpha/beta hydrolase [Pseudobdellovibrionaceae bacterium]